MKKRLVSIAIACLMVLAMVPFSVMAADVSEPMYLGFGSVGNFREGPGSDETGTPVYSFNYTYAVALFDADGKIVDVETDIIEISSPNYDGASMPHFSGWPGTAGYNVFNHATEAVDAPVAITAESFAAEVAAIKSKRERGTSYGMKEGNDWYKQTDFYEAWFRGQTIAEIRAWFNKNTTSAGRPIKPTTTNENDKAKLAALTEAEQAVLADVLAGATMSIEDPHGMTLTAIEKAFANKVEIKNGKDIVSLGLGLDRIDRNLRGNYNINITTVGAAFDAKGAIVASVFDILELSQDASHGTAPVLIGWPGTKSVAGNDITVDEVKGFFDNWQTKRERGDTYEMKTATNAGEWYEQMNFYQDWLVGQTIPALNTWFVKNTTAAGRPIKANTTNEDDLAKLAALTDAEKEALADVLTGATMSLEDPHGNMLTALKNAEKNKKSITASAAEHSAQVEKADAPDVVASASVRESSVPANIQYNLSSEGYWIHSLLSDATLEDMLIVDGTFYGSSGDVKGTKYRKLALYTQDDKRNVTAEFTLTTPRMVVESPNFRVQQGTVKGEVFVNADGFELYNSTINGNLIFANQTYLDSAKLDRGKVTGTITVGEVADAVGSASVKESVNAANIIHGLSDHGGWIFSARADMTLADALHVDGTFYGSSGDKNGKAYRKLALYTQDSKRTVTGEFTLTVPELFVCSPGFRIQQGTVKGNVHVNAFGFELYNSTIDGNLTFETQAQLDSSLLDKGKVTGTISVGYADTVGGATPRESSDPYRVNKSLSAEGYWIFSVLSDVTLTKPLNVDGTFYGKSGDINGTIDRKLALYAQDSSRKVTAEYTLTVPKMNVTSPNFRIVNGTVKGNVYVNARGFKLEGNAKIDGNLTFETQEMRDSATFDESKVTGTISVLG